MPAWAWLIINPANILLSSSHLLPPANMPVLQPPPSGAALRSRLADLRAMRDQGHRVSPRLEMGGDEAQGEAKELQGGKGEAGGSDAAGVGGSVRRPRVGVGVGIRARPCLNLGFCLFWIGIGVECVGR